MRYGLIPTRLAERFALWSHRLPVPIADCLLPLLQTRSLMAAVRLGVVDAIGEGEASVEQIARTCSLHADTLEMLLRVLVSAGYVSGRSGRYRLSALGRRALVRGAENDARGYVLFNYVQWEMVEYLERVLQTGNGVDFHERMQGERRWEWYQEAMIAMSRSAAPVLARLVPVKPGARTLVDVGGSHGLLGASICRRHPPMRAVVLELPAAVDQAREAAKQVGVADIVEHRAANVLEDSLPPADVVLMANLVHHFSHDDAVAAFGRARAALNAGGTLAVWDFDRPASNARPDLAADAAALYFRLTSTSQVVTGDEYATWLREAGFDRVRLERSALAPFQVLALGFK